MLERIIGERVVLRRPTKKDIPFFVEYCNSRDIARWIPVMPHPYTKKDAEWFVKDCAEKWKTDKNYQYAIEVEGELAGMIGLNRKEKGVAELGYWIAKPFQGQGITTEAARLVIDNAFKHMKLHRIEAKFLSGNEGSRRVMEKIGMTYEGTQRKRILRFGKYHDDIGYGLLKEDWKRRR